MPTFLKLGVWRDRKVWETSDRRGVIKHHQVVQCYFKSLKVTTQHRQPHFDLVIIGFGLQLHLFEYILWLGAGVQISFSTDSMEDHLEPESNHRCWRLEWLDGSSEQAMVCFCVVPTLNVHSLFFGLFHHIILENNDY